MLYIIFFVKLRKNDFQKISNNPSMEITSYDYNFLSNSKEYRLRCLRNAIEYIGYKKTIQELLLIYKNLKIKNVQDDIKSILHPYEFVLTQDVAIYCDELGMYIK